MPGDLLDRKALESGMEGCDWCFHVAASYQLWMRDYAPMYAANVEGTRNVLEAAGKAGCSRIVYTSTVGCIGLPKQCRTENSYAAPMGHEPRRIREAQMTNHYKRSKFLAEQVALELVAKRTAHHHRESVRTRSARAM